MASRLIIELTASESLQQNGWRRLYRMSPLGELKTLSGLRVYSQNMASISWMSPVAGTTLKPLSKAVQLIKRRSHML